ncbi:MAG TPA: nitrogenase iron-molybdenum cofactor biosynthesis protein NifN, partial [Azospirillaceae bacterium]|nr:nitrogenase iron-molybdenum cofactor biosynthesis protein NifN [Azospirillaceae bacterium]
LVLLVRHFREAIPLQTTALDQVTTILGGYDNLAEAIRTINDRNKPAMIGVCSTGVTETKGEDMAGSYRLFRQNNPDLKDLDLTFVNTPDFKGGLEDGFAAAVTGMIDVLVEPTEYRTLGQVNILAGAHLTPGDVEEIRDIVESFGLNPIILPDLGLSMSGRQPAGFTATTLGGTTVKQIRAMGRSEATLVLGESMRGAAAQLELKTDVPSLYFDRLLGLEACDRFYKTLSDISGRPVPAKFRRQRETLVDAMLDGHFYTGRKRVTIALEPDLLYAYTEFLGEMGADVVAAVAPQPAAVMEKVTANAVLIGDHADAERLSEEGGAELIISNAHARQSAERLGLPLLRAGLPTFDRIGAGHRVQVGYRGTRGLIFEIANIFLADELAHVDSLTPEHFHPTGAAHEGLAPATTH